LIGKRRVRRVDGFEKASESAVYTRDIYRPGMLYAKFLNSPRAHAKIKRLDTSKAEAFRGVRAILRYDDPSIANPALLFSSPFLPVVFLVYRKILVLTCRAGELRDISSSTLLFCPCLEKPNYYQLFSRTAMGASQDTHRLQIDLSGLMRSDLAQRWQAWEIAVRNNIPTADEARQDEGWNPKPANGLMVPI
jgi:hypothetical protein